MGNIHTITLDNIVYLLGYKVVTEDMKSLGLRKNPNILKYSMGEWLCLPKNEIREGQGDWGGIWVARTMAGANKLRKYIAEQHSRKTRIFETALSEILFSNNYRIKTNGVNLVREVDS